MLGASAKDAVIFVLKLGLISFSIWLLLSVTGLYPLKAFSASCASTLLNALGIQSTVLPGENPVVLADGLNAEVNDLCAGNVEIAVLLGAVLATPDRNRKERLIGALLGFLLIAAINPVRIWIVLWSASAQGLKTADLVHDLLFRGTLLFTIAGYYYAWYVLRVWKRAGILVRKAYKY